jgi:hypothetical protein
MSISLSVLLGKVDTSAVKTGFLSTLERFAPPRDISLEEPDICNPGKYICDSLNGPIRFIYSPADKGKYLRELCL